MRVYYKGIALNITGEIWRFNGRRHYVINKRQAKKAENPVQLNPAGTDWGIPVFDCKKQP